MPTDIPEAVVDAALQAYAARRWHNADITHPATRIILENELSHAAFRDAVEVAYRSGVEVALDQVEWRVSALVPAHPLTPRLTTRETWSACSSLEVARRDYRTAVSEGWTELWVEHRRVGAGEWKRVRDV